LAAWSQSPNRPPVDTSLYCAADAFLDVTVGNNAILATDFSPADPGNTAGLGWDLVSGLGWDLVSGLGSPDAYRLVTELGR